MTKVYIKDLRALGYCVRGVKKFCSKHDIDFKSFLQEGIDGDVLKQTKDGMAIKAIEIAEERTE